MERLPWLKDYTMINQLFIFHIRGWASVSQACHKEKVLSSILSSILGQKDSSCGIDDPNIEDNLYKCLNGNIYFSVINDIWDIGII